MALWTEKSPQLTAARQSFVQTFGKVAGIDLRMLVVKKIELNGDKAAIHVRVDLEANDRMTNKPSAGLGMLNRTLRMVREGGAWKITVYEPSEKELALAIVAAKTKVDQQALIDTDKDMITTDLGAALLQEGSRLIDQRLYSRARDIFLLDIDVATRVGNKFLLDRVLGDLGVISQAEGDYTEALDYTSKALTVAEEVSDKQVASHALWSTGYIHQLLGNYPEALKYLDKGLKLARDQGDTQNAAMALINIGAVYSEQGNFSEALMYYLKSLKLAEQLKNRLLIAGCFRSIGTVQLAQNNPAQSLQHFQASLSIYKEIDDKQGIAEILNEIASADEDRTKAIEGYQSSLKIAQEIGDKPLCASILGNLGMTYRGHRKFEQALRYFQESLKIFEEIGSQRSVCATLQNIGDTYLAQGDYGRAVDFSERAASLAERIDSPDTLASALTTAGSAYRKLNQHAKASQELGKAIALIEKMRALVAGSEQERQGFLEYRITPYYAMADLLLDQNNPSDALAFAERARARTLLDALESGRVDITKSLTVDEKEQEHKARSQLVSLNSQITTERLRKEPDERKLSSLSAQLEKARLEFEQIQANLYAAHPELKVHRAQFQAISLRECAGLLPNSNTALLEFLVMPDSVALFVLTREKAVTDAVQLGVHRIHIDKAKLADLCELFRGRLAHRDLTCTEPARKLYELLLGPAAADLQSKSNLVILPDGVLWELPFQALQSAPDRFLIEDHTISYAPSLTALREMSKLIRGKRAIDDRASLLALANPVIRPDDQIHIKEAFMGVKLDPLPQAEAQVRMIEKLYGPARSKVYVGANATEDVLKAQAGSCHILHLAGHGIVNNSSPMYSQIILSRADDSEDDGILEAWEIMNLDLKADLAVLSACDSARGRVRSGEGIIGLSWAFFVAGCPATVVSQWSVDADSTTDLMVEFHRNLVTGKNKAEALRQAELKLLKSRNYSHPFYWAPFVVMGDAN
jgi:CHAT domain-containing protein/uncharacterized protein HemY